MLKDKDTSDFLNYVKNMVYISAVLPGLEAIAQLGAPEINYRNNLNKREVAKSPQSCSTGDRMNHRIVWVGTDLKDHLVPIHVPLQGHLPLSQVVPIPIQLDLEHFQG